VQTEYLPQDAAQAAALNGRPDLAGRDHAETGFVTVAAEAAHDQEGPVPGTTPAAHGLELRAAGEAGALRQAERGHEAGELDDREDQAPVWRA
jgi:hypothetical protein